MDRACWIVSLCLVFGTQVFAAAPPAAGLAAELSLPPEQKDLLRSCRYHELQAILERSLLKDPNNPAAHYTLGLIFSQFDDNYRAIKAFDQAVRWGGVRGQVLGGRGLARFAANDFRGAIDDFSRAIELQSRAPQWRLGRAITHQRLGMHDNAKADFAEVKRFSDPANTSQQLELGCIYYQIDEYQAAIRCFTAAARQRSSAASALCRRGDMYRMMGDHVLALKDYNKALSVSPNNAVYFLVRGLLYKQLDRQKDAAKDLEKALKQGHPLDLLLLALPLANSPDEKVRDGKWAVDFATRACQNQQFKNPDSLEFLACAYAEVGQWEKAISCIDKAVRLLEDKDKIFLCWLERELFVQKHPFRQWRRKELKGRTASSAAEAVLFAIAEVRENDQDGGLAHLKQAIRLNPRLIAAHHLIGQVFDNQGKCEEAVRHFTRCLELGGKNAEILTSRASAYSNAGQEVESLRACLQSGLDLQLGAG